MIENFEQKLQKYAEVLIKIGLNVREGQRVMIGAPFFGVDGTPVEANLLVRELVRECYKAGAKYVAVQWDDEELQRIRLQQASLDSMEEYPTWKNDTAIDYVKNGDAMMIVFAQNPELFSGLDSEKVQAKQQVDGPHFHALFSLMAGGETNWLGASASIESWAVHVFPDVEAHIAKEKLWAAIFEACRINFDDPIAEWESHIANLAKRSDYLNAKAYTELRYKAPGTDLSVGLPDGHIWNSGALTSQNGITFVANIPTEEVFTLPHKDRVEGVVRATKPLSYSGSYMEDFTLKFSEGVVVNTSAEIGQDALDNILNTDENARSLGEVALVPHSSPISQSGLLFYNILYDENASNHLALGNAYRFSMKDAEEMSPEEFAAAGGNESIVHADFMIGSGEMDVDGVTADGSVEAIMRRGEWAFEV